MRRSVLILLGFIVAFVVSAQKVSIKAVDCDAATVFRDLMEQTGKNFVYSSEILDGLRITADFKNMPLRRALHRIFYDTDIRFRIKGNDVILTRRGKNKKIEKIPGNPAINQADVKDQIKPRMLQEVIVLSRLESPAVETVETGARKLTPADMDNVPTMAGERDVIKALTMQPGVTEGTAGVAGMNVHGGGADENLYMLDNVPLYHVNHLGGMFSAFNTEAVRYIDFFKSSVPVRYDGRLSSFLDVRTRNGSPDGRHGSVRLGTSIGSVNLDGPIGSRTTYMLSLRRTWADLIASPVIALTGDDDEEDIDSHYHFTDLNVKISHRFTDRATGYVSAYFGEDKLKSGSRKNFDSDVTGFSDDVRRHFHWGNFVAQTGLNYRFSSVMSAEFTAAHTRYFSWMKYNGTLADRRDDRETVTHTRLRTDNNINDWIFRADFDLMAAETSRLRFGVGYTLHSFLPAKNSRRYVFDDTETVSRDSVWSYRANEINAYVEDEWRLSDRLAANVGIHASLFGIDGKAHNGISPRISVNYRPCEQIAVKGAYTRTVQYVHQLTSTYLSLPTDQWIPVTGKFRPQTADKISAGIYWQPDGEKYLVSAEVYFKTMHNLVEYKDEYYLEPIAEMWNDRLTSGKGSARGIDFMVEKRVGAITGHAAYSLGWADRTFPQKNGGKTYPARFDNRHTFNILLNWNVSPKFQLGAAWTGHSGNRVTLLTQVWQAPGFDGQYKESDVPLRAPVNNYRLPFYHRLDLTMTLKNRHGYWTLSFYNLYCHRNVTGICRDYKYEGVDRIPVFQKVSLLPFVVPSISYTWQF